MGVYRVHDHPMTAMETSFVLYVRDQAVASDFYRRLLARSPRLDVPGMTEFQLTPGAVLGLMPSAGIKRLLGAAIPDPAYGDGIPRAELYLLVDDPSAFLDRAAGAYAKQLSPFTARDWGHHAAYFQDPDGHVIAIATASGGRGAGASDERGGPSASGASR